MASTFGTVQVPWFTRADGSRVPFAECREEVLARLALVTDDQWDAVARTTGNEVSDFAEGNLDDIDWDDERALRAAGVPHLRQRLIAGLELVDEPTNAMASFTFDGMRWNAQSAFVSHFGESASDTFEALCMLAETGVSSDAIGGGALMDVASIAAAVAVTGSWSSRIRNAIAQSPHDPAAALAAVLAQLEDIEAGAASMAEQWSRTHAAALASAGRPVR